MLDLHIWEKQEMNRSRANGSLLVALGVVVGGLPALLGCGAERPGSVEGQTDATVDASIEFVRGTYVEGIPYESARALSPSVVPVLLSMLEDEEEAVYWGNIAVTLAIVGDETAVEPLIEFIEQDVGGGVSDSLYRAKTSALMALGYLANEGGSEWALVYLMESVYPESWSLRGIEWQAPLHASAEERDVELSRVAILGLALSGREEARTALAIHLAESGGLSAAQDGLVENAVATLDRIAAVGLSAYYQEERAGFEP